MSDQIGQAGEPVADAETKAAVRSAAESLQSAKDESQRQAAGTLNSVKDSARGAAEAGRDVLQDGFASAKNAAKDKAAREAELRKTQAANYAGAAASDLRVAAKDVSNEWLAMALGEGARGFDRVSDAMRGKTVGEIVDDTRRFAKEHPATFITGAFAAGLAINRTLRVAKHQSSFTDENGQFFKGDDQRSGDIENSVNEPYTDFQTPRSQ